MGMGRRKRETQHEFWLATDSLPVIPQNYFYDNLNKLLAEAGFDDFIEELCEPYYAGSQGRPSVPPGVYFRMLFLGYFEGIGSDRGIAWRIADSRSLASFLGYPPNKATPDHSSFTKIRDRLPLEVHNAAFVFVMKILEKHNLLKGKTLAVDATTLEANASMKNIVRKESGEDWKEYVRRLAAEEGVIIEDDDDLRRFDRKRKSKKVSNKDWESSSDKDSRIAKMKDGRTHLAYKAEHVIDLETEAILAAEIHHADQGDSETVLKSLSAARENLLAVDYDKRIEEVVTDKGYHSATFLEETFFWNFFGLRTYIAEPQRTTYWRWKDRLAIQRQAVLGNRRRTKGKRGRRLQKLRSERVERSFAHVCETGGARRTWLRGLEKIKKRYSLQAAAHNLSLVMRKLFGFGKPRCLQGGFAFAYSLQFAREFVSRWKNMRNRFQKSNVKIERQTKLLFLAV